MIESTVPLARALALACWSISAGLLVTAWIAFSLGHDALAMMLGLTSVMSTTAAALLMINGWVSRVCQVVRVTREPAGITPFR